MVKETFHKLVTLNQFQFHGSGVKARMSVRVVSNDTNEGSVIVQLKGVNSESEIYLNPLEAEKLAPAYGEVFVVEVRRQTEEEKEVSRLQSAIEFITGALTVKDHVRVARFLNNHPEVSEQLELVKDLIQEALLDYNVYGFFEKVQEVRNQLSSGQIPCV